MGLVDYVKQKTGIGRTLSERKKQIDEVGAPVQQPAPQAVPAPAPAPEVKLDPNSAGDQKYLEMKQKYGLKDGGVIDKTLLKRKAEVMKKRGC